MKPLKIVFKLYFLALACGIHFFGCEQNQNQKPIPTSGTYILVLGHVQDAGSPQAGCTKKCCENLFEKPNPSRKVVSLGLVDTKNEKTYLIEASPDFTQQNYLLQKQSNFKNHTQQADGIFVSHAHIGHYTGLMVLGREAMNAKEVPVYVLPRMKTFLETQAPYSQLCELKNIKLVPLYKDSILQLNSQIKIKTLLVPHRDEFSETAGFIIEGPHKKLLFIPDIDKWEKWEISILDLIQQVDYALLDGTFYSGEELPNRNLKEIPHPLVIESMNLFKNLALKDKNKIHFVHFNHTNPLLDSSSKELQDLKTKGFNTAGFLQKFEL